MQKYFRKFKHHLVFVIIFISLYVTVSNVILLLAKSESSKYDVLKKYTPEIQFGLDIVGGSQLLLKIDFDAFLKDKYISLKEIAKDSLWQNRIRYKVIKLSNDKDSIVINLNSDFSKSKFKKCIKDIDVGLSVDYEGDNAIIYYDKSQINLLRASVIEQSLKIVRNRIDESGTKEIILQRFGLDKLVLQIPGVDDPSQIKRKLGKVAKLSFHMVDKDNPIVYPSSYIEEGKMSLPHQSGQWNFKVSSTPELTGEHLIDAKVDITNFKSSIVFRLDRFGSEQFSKITERSVGRAMAIVLDGVVLTAPTIQEKINGGTGSISGSYSKEEASELANMLRSGALPAPIKVIEERTIGPSVGGKTIQNAKYASLVGVLLVIIFMISYYGLLGLIASFAIVLNLFISFSIMSIFGITLTLSGISGLILTLGMSVDANVLIYERMRDESRALRRISDAINNSLIIRNGFMGAWSGILDSNITTILSAMTMIFFGSGFIKGFATSLIIGILASLFSSVFLTKVLVEAFYSRKKNKVCIQ